MEHLKIQKLFSCISNNRGPFIPLQRVENESQIVRKKKHKTVKRSKSFNEVARKYYKSALHGNSRELDQCSLCGISAGRDSLHEDVLEFEILITYFYTECSELCRVSLYCKHCQNVFNSLREFHKELLKVKQGLEDRVALLKFAFKLRRARDLEPGCSTSQPATANREEVSTIQSVCDADLIDNLELNDVNSLKSEKSDEEPEGMGDVERIEPVDNCCDERTDDVEFNDVLSIEPLDNCFDMQIEDVGINDALSIASDDFEEKPVIVDEELNLTIDKENDFDLLCLDDILGNNEEFLESSGQDPATEDQNDGIENLSVPDLLDGAGMPVVISSNHSCTSCGTDFTSELELEGHTCNQPTDPYPHKCEQCGLTFARLAKLKAHEAFSHALENANKEDGQHEPKDVEMDQENQESDYDFSDSDTDASSDFDMSGVQSERVGNFRPSSGPYACPVCQKEFDMAIGVEKHFETDHPGEKYNCAHCDSSFSYFRGLRRHVKAHLTAKRNPLKSLKCEECSEEYEDKEEFRRHLQTHTEALRKERSFLCPSCNETFQNGKELEDHYNSRHKEQNYKCSSCEEKFTGFYDLLFHTNDVHRKQVQRFKCARCPKTFRGWDELKKHLSRNHYKKLKELRDQRSGAKWRKISRSRSRKRNQSLNVKGCFKCADCLDELEYWQDLKEHLKDKHLKSVAGEENQLIFKCPNCSLFGSDVDVITKHVKEEHQNERVIAFFLAWGADRFFGRLMSNNETVQVENKKPADTCATDKNVLSKEITSNSVTEDTRTDIQEKAKDTLIPNADGGCLQQEFEGGVASIRNTENNGATDTNVEAFSSETNGLDTILLDEPKVENESEDSNRDPTSEQIPYSCRLCTIDCITSNEMEAHFKQSHPGGAPFVCHLCPKKFFTEDGRQTHLRLCKEKELFICELCGEQFFRKSALEAHINWHNQKPEKCPQCEETLPNKDALEEHKRVIHEGKKPSPYVCLKCPAYFVKEKALGRHKTSVHPAGDWKPKTCTTCGKLFRFKVRFESHIHVDGNIHYRCLHCGLGKVFTRWEKLEAHLARYHDGKAKKKKNEKTQCEQCGLILRKNSLPTHNAKFHLQTEEERKTCKLCNETFPSFSARQKHDREVHLGRSLFQCYFCEKKFAIQALMDYHMKNHTKEGLECPKCKKFFKNEQVLRRHMFTACGTDEARVAAQRKRNREAIAKYRAKKPYVCEKCGARYGQKPMLKSHEKKCTG